MHARTRKSRQPLSLPLNRFRSALSIAAVLAIFSPALHAADFQWDPVGDQSNSGGAGIWDLTSFFWNDDSVAPNLAWPNAVDSVAVFGGTGGAVTIDTGVAGTGIIANGLRFGVDGYILSSDEASELITLTGPTATLEVTTGTATINSVVAGTTTLLKTGAGTLALRSATANTFTGPIQVTGGTLNFTADNQLGSTANTILLDGGALDYQGTAADWDPAATRIITIGGAGGTIRSGRAIRITDAGQITGAGTLIREAAGTTYGLDLQAANVGFTGSTVVNSGTIEFRNNLALGNTPGQSVTVNGGIFTIATGPQTGNFAPTLSQPVTLAGGTLAFGNQVGGNYAGPVDVTADSAISVRDFYQSANRGGAISGLLSGNGRLTVSGVTTGFVAGTPSVGSVLLTNPVNSYSGTIAIQGGAHVRAIQGGGAEALGTATIELNGGALGLAPLLTGAGPDSGFFGRYYNSAKINNGVSGGFDFGAEPIALSRTDATVNYAASAPGGSGVNGTNIGVLWTGILQVTTPGTYAFSFRSDDGSMIYVNGQQVVGNDFSQGATERFGSIFLAAGNYPVIMKYAQGGGGAAAQAFYNGPDTANAKVLLGSVPNSITNIGDALFAPTTLDNNIQVVTTGEIDLAGANGTSTGSINFNGGASLRVTGVTGFETLTQTGPVTLNGTNTISAGITLTGNQTNTHGHQSSGADLVISGIVSEATAGSSLIKDGPRKVSLTGANTFTGPITINGGTLAGNSGSLPSSITVNAGGTIEFAQATDGSFGQQILGTGTFRKTGAGRLSLDTVNTFTGSAFVEEGILGGFGSLDGSVVVEAGAAVAGVTGSTFVMGSLTFQPGSLAEFTLAAPSPLAHIALAGALNPSLTKITLADGGGITAGTYRLIDYEGAALSNRDIAGMTIASSPVGHFFGIVHNTAETAIDLAVEAPNPINTWTGAVDEVWQPTTPANWSSGGYTEGEQVIFPDSVANRTITGPSVSPQRITVNTTAANHYSIANSIQGTLAGGLQKNGAGTLTLTGANTFTGPIVINGGTLSANVASATSALGAGAVSLAPGTTLDLTPTADISTPGISSRYFSTTPDGTTNGGTILTGFNFGQNAGALQTDTNLDPAAYTQTSLPAGGAVGFDESTGNTNWKNFAIERIGKIQITTAGWYGFHTFSDDGSRIFINGQLIANIDGGHGNIEGNGAVYLTPGLHDFRYEFIQGTGGGDERLSYSGPGIPKQVIPSSVLFAAESSSLAGSSNDIILGTPITAAGSATLSLNGGQFTGVRVGILDTNGGTLTVAGEAGKRLAAEATVLRDSITLNNTPSLALGMVTDLGSGVTITKTGSGRLILDHNAGGADSSSLSSDTVIDLQAGELYVKHSNVAGTSNPLGSAQISLNGGNVVLDTAVGGYTMTNPITAVQSGSVITRTQNQTITLAGAMQIQNGATLTLDVSDGTRGSNANTTIPGQAAAGGTVNITGIISGPGDLALVSNQTTSAQAPLAGTFFLRQPAVHTGLTRIEGQFVSQTSLDIRGQGTLLATSGVNQPGEIELLSTRINLFNNDGGNLNNRLPDAFPITMTDSTIRFDGANGTSSNETIGAITLAAGQNNLFGGTVSGTAFHTLTAASITRQNRATLRLDANAVGSLSAANGVRFVFTDPSGFTNDLVGGSGSTATNGKIIPWVWGGPTGNNRTLVTYGANGLRTLADTEFATLAGSVDTTDNIRHTYTGAASAGSGAAQTMNSLVVVNTGTGDATLTLTAGTNLSITSGALFLGTTDGTARRVVLAGGSVDFGAAEGVIVASRREHAITSQILGTNGLTITGDGALTLNNNTNSFTGDIVVNLGASPTTATIGLFAQNDQSLGNADNDLFLNGSGFRFNSAFTLNANRTVHIGAAGTAIDTNNLAVGIAGQVTGSGPFYKTNGNTLTLNNPANNYTGDTYILNGNLVTNTGPQGDIHHDAVDGGGFAGTNRTLTFDQAFDGTYGGNIDGVGDVVKSGSGLVRFTGDHTYVGTTTVTGGTLMLNGSISGSTTTVQAGTLGGTGSIGFDLVLGNATGSADAILAPGEGIGTFTVGGDVSFLSDAGFLLQLDSTSVTTDRLNAGGSIQLGAGIVPLAGFDLNPVTLTNGEVFTFLSASDGVFGEFAGLPDGSQIAIGSNDFTIDYTATTVNLVAVPEPAGAAVLLAGLGVLAAARRRQRR